MAPSWSSSPLAGVRLTPGKDPLLDAGDAHMRRRTTRQQGPKRFQKKKHLGFLITAPAIGFAARTRTPRRVTVAGSHGHGLPLSLEICGLVYGVRT
jgi:hypothetical protein